MLPMARRTKPRTTRRQTGTTGHRMNAIAIIRANTKTNSMPPTIMAMAMNTVRNKTRVVAAVSFLSWQYLP